MRTALVPILLVTACGRMAPSSESSPRATTRENATAMMTRDNFSLERWPASDERHWTDLLWNAGIVHPDVAFISDSVASLLEKALDASPTRPERNTLLAALRLANQLYTQRAATMLRHENLIRRIATESPHATMALMALAALAKGERLASEEVLRMTEGLKARFPAWQSDDTLKSGIGDLVAYANRVSNPPLRDLLATSVRAGQAHLFVLCRRHRGHACRAVLRQHDGRWVRGDDSQIWSVLLLANSVGQVRWNFRFGQTPQGIYRMDGTNPPGVYTAYGRYPLVKLGMPHEDAGFPFFPQGAAVWRPTGEQYAKLLPPSWRSHFPIYESYWAGKLGRGAIRIHGSGEPVDTFAVKAHTQPPESHHLNPSAGCLSAYEKAGSTEGDMPRILATLERASGRGRIEGYVVVAEIDPDRTGPVTLEEIERAL